MRYKPQCMDCFCFFAGGKCHRFPPDHKNRWAWVNGNDWCAEWKSRTAGDTPGGAPAEADKCGLDDALSN